MSQGNTKKLFASLSENLDVFLKVVKQKKQSLMATSRWTVKDVLCHITFWHAYYASNYRALALKKEPKLLNGSGYELNQTGVDSLRKYKIESIIRRLRRAHASLYKSIVASKVPRMTYKYGGRVYETNDFLLMVARHLNTHTQQIKSAK